MVDVVASIMIRDVITCDANDSVQKIATMMRDKGFGSLIVTEKDSPVGIVTERDLVQNVLSENLDASKVKIKKVMSSPLKSVDSRSTIEAAGQFMRENKIKKLPIIDKGKLVGLITQTDIVRYYEVLH
jgi:CBS domain-containing protein